MVSSTRERFGALLGRKPAVNYEEQNRVGDHICYISDLTKMRTHYPTWDISKTLDDIFQIQDDIARAVVDKLRLTLLTGVPSASSLATNTEAHNLYLQGQMSERDWKSYWDLYQTVITILQPPDLVIYLQASVPVLQQRIRQRGRDYEQEIQVEYLTRLNDLYDRWVESFTLCPVLTVPTDEFDFVSHNAHLELIAARVLEKLHGKEVVVFQ